MPVQLIRERYILQTKQQSPFVQEANLFQDVVIRCVRIAFAKIPASIGRVFFSKGVSLPFMRYRMLRHGIVKPPLTWQETPLGTATGVYMIENPAKPPGILIYYCHGGAFAMGSPYFYMEFLMAWMTLLKQAGYENPAVLAIDYTLVPKATYPTQLQQVLEGYKHALTLIKAADRLVVSGDSAGGTLILSLLLCLATVNNKRDQLPALAVLISPWTTLISSNNRNTASDYLDAETLQIHAELYIGKLAASDDAIVSPGNCDDLSRWRRASPSKGMFFIYGEQEVFAPEIDTLASRLRKAGLSIESYKEPAGIHAWPVVKLFLSNTKSGRLSGLSKIVQVIADHLPKQT